MYQKNAKRKLMRTMFSIFNKKECYVLTKIKYMVQKNSHLELILIKKLTEAQNYPLDFMIPQSLNRYMCYSLRETQMPTMDYLLKVEKKQSKYFDKLFLRYTLQKHLVIQDNFRKIMIC